MGIGATGGHMGLTDGMVTANTIKSIGGTLFGATMSGVGVAAGVFGGPAASAAVSVVASAGNTAIAQTGYTAQKPGLDVSSSIGAAQPDAYALQLQSQTNAQAEVFEMVPDIDNAKQNGQMSAIQQTA